MKIFRPSSPLEAVEARKNNPDSLYLAGGTDDLRLGGGAKEDSLLIDVNGIVPSEIALLPDGRLSIGAGATLSSLASSPLVPSFIREAALFCPSLERRNAATVGGNIALRSFTSYLIPSFVASEAELVSITPHGEETKKVADYVFTKCKRLILEFIVDPSRSGRSVRFSLTSSSASALTAASSSGVYAYASSSSGFACGDKDSWKKIDFASDKAGSGEYKAYLASVAFEGGEK